MTSYPEGTWRNTRALFTFAGCAMLFFIVYGSLVPLDFHAVPWDEAQRTFQRLPYYGLTLDSSADWVTNVLLFVPLSFVWLGVLWHLRPSRWPIFRVVLVWAACICTSLVVEFAQIYFPPRVPDFNDIVAQAIGAPIGIVLWLLFGPATVEWLRGWTQVSGPSLVSRRLLYLYLGVIYIYGLFPLDLSISLTDLYHKWSEGRIVLVPFEFHYSDPTAFAYGLATDVLIWIPVGVLWGACARTSLASTWFRAICAATLLEFLQLFVLTRVTDVTSVLTAAAGSGLGLLVVRNIGIAGPVAPRGDMRRASLCSALLPLAGVGLWLIVIVTVFWYPFQFDAHHEFAAQHWKSFSKVPFATYATSSEYRAVTELLHKTSFFAPLGLLLGVIVARIGRPRGLYLASAVVFVAGVAAAIEVGKVFLPGKTLDTANWLLEVLGGCAGLWAAIALFPLLTRTAPSLGSEGRSCARERATAILEKRSERDGARARREDADAIAGSRTPVRWDVLRSRSGVAYAIATPMIMGLLLWWVTRLPDVPYNLRQLLHPAFPLLSAVLVCTALLWTTALPPWLARQVQLHRSYLILYPFATIGHAAVAWLIIYVGVEPIRIHKVVGSPVLGWPWELETIGRFLALYSGISLFSVAGSLLAPVGPGTSRGQGWAIWSVTAVWALPVVYWGVIDQAATDNLTELLNYGAGSLAFLLAGLYIVLVSAIGGCLASVRLRRPGSVLLIVVLAAGSFPLGYWVLNSALEPLIIKYNQVFSGLQFLLSADRQHYAEGSALLLRFAMLHAVLLAVFTLGGWLAQSLRQRVLGIDGVSIRRPG